MAVARGLMGASVGGLLLAAVPVVAHAQATTGTITGRVVDSTSQQPLPNVTVSVPGTQRGALTGPDGRYTIGAVPVGTQTVRAARIGYGARTQQVTVAAGTSAVANFSVAAQTANLSEVVVVGYGTQTRESITGSVAQVSGDEANVGVIANANQLITGRVAGVNVTSNNGEPGGGVQVRIRGGTSISASNDPLYVVDGVPLQGENAVANGLGIGGGGAALLRNPLNSLNPNDIASITVLKDASATAIYGSRGANGVVLIETKRGQAGASQVEYDGYVGAGTAARQLDLVNAGQYRDFVTAQVAINRTDSTRGLPATALNGLGSANTNWFDQLTRVGVTNNHNLSFSGGSQTTQYRAALNYFDQQGVVIANGLTRYQGRINAQNQSLGGRLQTQLNLTASRVNNQFLPFENGGGFTGGVFTNAAIFNPTRAVRDTAGRFYEIGTGAQDVRNPVALARQIVDRAPENRVLGNLTASYELIPSLISRTTVGVDVQNSVRQTYIPIASPVGAATNGQARQAERDLQNINFQQLLTFTPRLGTNNSLEVLGGYEYTDFGERGVEVEGRGFLTDVLRFDNLGAANQLASPPPVSYNVPSALVSFFTRANYNYKGRYFLSGVLRRDGSSRLAPGNKWANFPGISASWRVSEEGFMSGRPLGLSTLAVRAGYGVQGSQAVRPYGTQLLFRPDPGARYPLTDVDRPITGFSATQVPNADLKWETSRQTNVGLDYGLANNRFTGALDFYTKTTKDLLLEVAVPQPAVVPTRIENVGSVRNRGFEASLDANLLNDARRSFSSGLVLSVERNEVTSLGRPFISTATVFGQGQSGQLAQRLIPGQPIGTFWGVEYAGNNAQGQQQFRCDRSGTGNADCVNGLTLRKNAADERIIGNANPDFSLGFRSNAALGAFDLSWLWRAEVGRDVFNNTALVYGTTSNATQGRNFLASALSDQTAFGEPAIYSSRWIENGSFLRLQNAQVGYTFRLPGRLGSGRQTRVYVAGDNLVLFSGYSGLDPEVFVRAGGTDVVGAASRGIDYLVYPRARTFTAGTRIQF